MRRKWEIAACGLFALAATFVFWPFRFSYDSVCSRCGMERRTIEWQLPHSRFTFFTWSFTAQTPLSTYLTSSGIVGPHSHAWLFGHGGGNGIKCALGDGDSIRATAESPEVVRLLAFSKQFDNQHESTNLLKYVFDRDISSDIRSIAHSVPTNGFAAQDEYHAWFTDHDFPIQEALSIQKETDAEYQQRQNYQQNQ
jgi:hypothetical protein